MSVPNPAAVDWVPLWVTAPGSGIPPAQPAARVYRSTTQNLPNSAFTILSYDTVRFDRGGPHWVAGSPTRLTCQVAGVYVIVGNATVPNVGGGNHRVAQLLVNGSVIAADMGEAGASFSVAANIRYGVATVTYLNVGDYVEFQLFQDSGSALATVAGSAGNQANSDLMMALVGGMQGPAGGMQGQELGYAQLVSQVNQTSTSEAAPNDIVALPAITFDGVTPVMFDFFCQAVQAPAGTTGNVLYLALYDGSTVVQRIGMVTQCSAAGVANYFTMRGGCRLTPSAGSHTYKVGAYGTASGGAIIAGPGGAASTAPTWLRATRVPA